jgi:hypothetical protein
MASPPLGVPVECSAALGPIVAVLRLGLEMGRETADINLLSFDVTDFSPNGTREERTYSVRRYPKRHKLAPPSSLLGWGVLGLNQ